VLRGRIEASSQVILSIHTYRRVQEVQEVQEVSYKQFLNPVPCLGLL
jgi:hypothetical protein